MRDNPDIIIKSAVTTSGTPRSVSFALANTVWANVVSMRMKFVADATPGQRMFNVDIVDASGNVVFSPAAMPVNASQSVSLQMAAEANPGTNTVTGQEIPERLHVPPGATIKVTDANGILSSGDTVAMNMVIAY